MQCWQVILIVCIKHIVLNSKENAFTLKQFFLCSCQRCRHIDLKTKAAGIFLTSECLDTPGRLVSLKCLEGERWDRGRGNRYPRESRGRDEVTDGWGDERLRSNSYRGQGISYLEQEEANRRGCQPKYSGWDGQVMQQHGSKTARAVTSSSARWRATEMARRALLAPAKLSQVVVQAPVWHGPWDQCSWRKTSISVCQNQEKLLQSFFSAVRRVQQEAGVHWAVLLKVWPGYTTLGFRAHFIFVSIQQATIKPTNII